MKGSGQAFGIFAQVTDLKPTCGRVVGSYRRTLREFDDQPGSLCALVLTGSFSYELSALWCAFL
jgi:hypothetical protein